MISKNCPVLCWDWLNIANILASHMLLPAQGNNKQALSEQPSPASVADKIALLYSYTEGLNMIIYPDYS